VREVQETQVSQVELFLNSVPSLSPLTKEERMRLVDALEEVTYPAGKLICALECSFDWLCTRC
jgi:cGMP-dependent protein kinase 2